MNTNPPIHFYHPLVVAYGGGLNSTAMLVGMAIKGIVPDLILFADTGDGKERPGEKPETYEYIPYFSDWLHKQGLPEVTYVRKGGANVTLEEDCLNKKHLPSIVYGYKSCSQKFKREAQDKFINNWVPARRHWLMGGRIQKAIGYDAGEERRAHIADDPKYTHVYPLILWGWFRQECVDALQRAGLCIPPKCACFFCPSSKKHEVISLSVEHPELFDRAVAMERLAEAYNTSVKGLGRHWTWEQLAVDYRAGLIDAQGKPIKTCSLPVLDREDSDFVNCDCFDTAESNP